MSGSLLYTSIPLNSLNSLCSVSICRYVLVNNESVVLGGTRYENDWNLEVSEEDKAKIWRNTQEIVPSLAEAKWIKDWVGLRPARKQVRIEREVVR